jgi:hypothetical protein
MGYRLAYLVRAPLLAIVVSAGVFSASAQRQPPRSFQPILFSSPGSESVQTNLSPLASKSPGTPALEDATPAPLPFDLGGPSADLPLPASPPAVSRAEALRFRELMDRRKNWILLTPAEILGVNTPEKIMGIQERDAAGRPKNLTALERYTERRNLAASAFTNSAPFLLWNNPSNKSAALPGGLPGNWAGPDNPSGTLFDSTPDNQNPAGQNDNNSWSRLFGSPAPAPMAAPAREADMGRFKQLLRTGSSAPVAATPALGGAKAVLPQTALSSGLGQSALTPIGASFTPLNSGIGRPPELPKLPSIWSLSPTSAPAAAVWAPQPPPWLSPTPQPFAAPQRKF